MIKAHGLTHDQAMKLAHGGFRVTRFEGIGTEVVRIIYERTEKPQIRKSKKSSKR